MYAGVTKTIPRYMLHVIVFAVDSRDTTRISMFENFENSDLLKSMFCRVWATREILGRKGTKSTEDKEDQFMIQGSKNWSSNLKLRKSRNLFQTDRKCPLFENQKGLELRSIDLIFFSRTESFKMI